MANRALIWCGVLVFFVTISARAEITTDFLMDRVPEIRYPEPIKKFSPEYLRRWIEALERPEIDMQRMSAHTIAQAHRRGFPGMLEAVPALEKILLAETSHPSARFASARALIVLESRDSAENLLKASHEFGADLRQLVEPVMAEWNVLSARAVWKKRLETLSTRHRDLILAMRCLARVRDTTALPTLRKISLEAVRGPDIRIEAAASAGQLAETGLEQDAIQLTHQTNMSPTINRLCAVRLLARHDSEPARQILLELATDAEPTVASQALDRLNSIDKSLVLPLAETAMKNADPLVREQGANAYLSLPTPARIGPLVQLLDDPHPRIRKQICEALTQLAEKSELDLPIREGAMQILAGQDWQGQEQAGLLLGVLDHKPAAGRLVELLESPRREVYITAAWALRKVAVPETVSAILDKIRRQTTIRKAQPTPEIDDQVAHLFEACGQMKSAAAIPLMLEYVPKDLPLGELSRSAAIWSLGNYFESVPDEAVAQALIERATDAALLPPEFPLVKKLSIVSLGRMKAVKHAPAIRKIIEGGTPQSPLGLACRWAVKELTGEEMPEPLPGRYPTGTWFLEPLLPQE